MKKVIYIILLSLFHMNYSITIIGHRGACGYAPENTLSSFAKAIELGVDIIECDIRRCASGELVVFHDAKIDRLTNSSGYISSLSLQELKQLKVLEQESIPTLEEACDFINRRVKMYIELKSLNIIQDVLKLIEYYVRHRGWHYSDFLIASFDHTQLLMVREKNIPILIVALIYGVPVSLEKSLEGLNPDIVCLDYEFCPSELLKTIRQDGSLIYIYTINDHEDFLCIKNYAIDGIITDYPDRIKNYLKS